MNEVTLIKKPYLAVLLLWAVIVMPSPVFSQTLPEDEYLTKAFAALKENPPPEPTELQRKLIAEIKTEIEKSAAAEKFFVPAAEHAAEIGWTGFPVIAELLRSPNSWTRALAARALFMFDRRRSIPFLIGQLSDQGLFKYMDDVVTYTVSDQAGSLIRQAKHGTDYFITPVRETGNPSAKIKSIQNYYWFHLPFCKWINEVCFVETARMIAQFEIERFGKPAYDDGYEGVNYVFAASPSGKNRFRTGAPVNINLSFSHFGNRIIKIRWDIRDTAIHKFKLIAPDGKELKLNPAGLPTLPELVPVLQPQWSESSLGKNLNLAAMYDISQTGIYTFHYQYTPPAVRKPNEQSIPIHLWYWDGKDYVNYYEFVVE